MLNCTSLAFKLDTAVDPNYERAIEVGCTQAITEMALMHNRKIRKIENENSPLMEYEWMILFFGFYKTEIKVYGFPQEVFDYHFILRQDDGTWVEINRGETLPKPVDITPLIEDAKMRHINYQFYAVSNEK